MLPGAFDAFRKIGHQPTPNRLGTGMLDSLRELETFVGANRQQITGKLCMEWTGMGTDSHNAPHIHKQHGRILRGGYRNQHRLSRNAGIYFRKYGTRRGFPKILVLPQMSLQDITAMPDSTIPIFSVTLPSERITSPL